MGWSIGWDSTWNRDIGYGVPATCDHPKCRRKIDRGLSFVCGGEPYGGDKGCGLFFCSNHLFLGLGTKAITGPQLCERCAEGKEAFEPKPDHKEWIRWKLKDASWQQWRDEHPEEVKKMRAAIRSATERSA